MLECKILKTGEVTDENGKRGLLTYGLITGSADVGSVMAETYGIGIIAQWEDSVDVEMAEDISPDLLHVEGLVEKLWRNQVTPTSLMDIIHDDIEN